MLRPPEGKVLRPPLDRLGNRHLQGLGQSRFFPLGSWADDTGLVYTGPVYTPGCYVDRRYWL